MMEANEAMKAMAERGWACLKDRCCSDPKEAKRCVMVSKDDFRAAPSAAIGGAP